MGKWLARVPTAPQPLRRIPLTVSLVLLVLLVSALTRTMMRPATSEQLAFWGFGTEALGHGRFDKLLLSLMQVYRPYMVVTISSLLLVFMGLCEYLYGCRRTLLVVAVGHAIAYTGAFSLLWALQHAGVGWAATLVARPDVGASAAGFAAAGAALTAFPAALRRTAFMALLTYLLLFVAFDRRIWDIEHLLAFPTGVLLGLLFVSRRGGAITPLWGMPRVAAAQRAAVVAWGTGAMGLVNILSAFFSPHSRRLNLLEANLPVGAAAAARHVTLVLGFALLLLALGLARRRRQAWLLACAVLALSLGLHVAKGAQLHTELLTAAVLVLMVRWRGAFTAATPPPSARRALLGLAGVVLFLPLYGITGFFVLRYQFTEVYSLGSALAETAARLAFSSFATFAPETRRAHWFLDSIPVIGWAALLYGLAGLVRVRPAPESSISERERAGQLLRHYGRGGVSFMSLWPGNALFFGPKRGCYIAYRHSGSMAVMLGGPVGPDELQAETLQAFAQFCEAQGWSLCGYAVDAATLPLYQAAGYNALKLGEEAVISLPSLTFKGKEWQDVRSALNRAAREGLTFHLYQGGSLPPRLQDQVFAISRAWVEQKALPEMGFTLGTAQDTLEPPVMVALAVDAAEQVQGFLTWLPVYAEIGRVLDLMRRAPSAMPGIMEFLIGSSLLAFQANGDQMASLATAPLAGMQAGGNPPLTHVLEYVSRRLDRYYHFQSLFAFKKKFRPQWREVYVVYRAPTELPAIALAILRAHLPQLGPRLAARIAGEALTNRRDRGNRVTTETDAAATT